jgi:hypothetical protein
MNYKTQIKDAKSLFKNLKQKIIDILEKMEDATVKELQTTANLSDSLIEEYNRLARKRELGDIILAKTTNLQQKSDAIKAIVNNVKESSNSIE